MDITSQIIAEQDTIIGLDDRIIEKLEWQAAFWKAAYGKLFDAVNEAHPDWLDEHMRKGDLDWEEE